MQLRNSRGYFVYFKMTTKLHNLFSYINIFFYSDINVSYVTRLKNVWKIEKNTLQFSKCCNLRFLKITLFLKIIGRAKRALVRHASRNRLRGKIAWHQSMEQLDFEEATVCLTISSWASMGNKNASEMTQIHCLEDKNPNLLAAVNIY